MTDIVEKLRQRDEYEVILDHLDRPYGLDKSIEHDAADEIERLRGEKDEWIGRYQAELDDNHRMIAWYKEACTERDRLRQALERAADTLSDASLLDAWADARTALGERR
jgi:hypothetical protein